MTYRGVVPLLALALATGTGCHPPRPTTPIGASARADAIRVLTWNVLKNDNTSYGTTCETIVGAGAPIVMLQEVTEDMESHLRPCLAEHGFWLDLCIRKPPATGTEDYTWYPAIASNLERVGEPICDVHRTSALPNGFLLADVRTDRGVVRIVNAHLAPDGENPLNWRAHARDRVGQVEDLLRKPGPPMAIIAGDFNENARGGAVRMLQSHGYREATETLPAVRDRPTWNYCWPKGSGPIASHVDFVFHDASFTTVDAELLPYGPSDHRPLLVTLRRPASHRPCASR